MQPEYGTVTLRSKVAREVRLIGITLRAPLASYLLTPGTFTADVVTVFESRTQPGGAVYQPRARIELAA